VIVAVVAVRMVQVSVDQIIGVISMRHHFVTAARSVPMSRVVSAAAVLRGAPIGIRFAYFNYMFVNVIFMRIMEMTVVKVVDVAVVPNRDMTAVGSVDMRMIGVNRMVMSWHFLSFSLNGRRDRRRF
jgi:hypothetical protein